MLIQESQDRLLRYQRLDLSIIPLVHKEKHPAITWKLYQSERVTESVLLGWVNRSKANYNFGIVTGAISGVIVVDADSPEAVAWVEANLPSTAMRTRTAKGVHYFYRHPGPKVLNGVKLAGMLLDVRGDGGYVVAPGSIHPSGFVYQEEGEWGCLNNLPVFDPAWISSEGKTLEEQIAEFIRKAAPSIEGMNGSKGLMSFAGKLLRKFRITHEQAREALETFNRTKADPKWSEEELDRALNSAEARRDNPNSMSEGSSAGLEKCLIRDDKGKVLNYQRNLELILSLHNEFKKTLSLCLFTRRILNTGPLPWRNEVGTPWTDVDSFFFKAWIESEYGLSPKDNLINGAIATVSYSKRVHPVRVYLDALKWDGICRVSSWTHTYFGVEDTPYSSRVGEILLLQGVARIQNPGIKADHIVVLEGAQGLGKSTGLRNLVPNPDWFEDSLPDINSKDGRMGLEGKWIIEFQEFDYMSKVEAAKLKAFITDQEDSFRAPYARYVETHKRQCIFAGTTNEKSYLPDTTGNRRFLPLECSRVDFEGLARDRDQLWAEAMHLFRNGARWHLTQEEMAGVREIQDVRRLEDPWEIKIGEYLTNRLSVTLAEVMVKGLDFATANCRSTEAYRVSRIITGVFGWKKTKVEHNKTRINGFTPPPDPVRPPEGGVGHSQVIDNAGDVQHNQHVQPLFDNYI